MQFVGQNDEVSQLLEFHLVSLLPMSPPTAHNKASAGSGH